MSVFLLMISSDADDSRLAQLFRQPLEKALFMCKKG